MYRSTGFEYNFHLFQNYAKRAKFASHDEFSLHL